MKQQVAMKRHVTRLEFVRNKGVVGLVSRYSPVENY
jgi:hypothetical protein